MGGATPLAGGISLRRDSISFSNRDWVRVTLSYYRSRWMRGEESEPRYDELQKQLNQVQVLSVPALMIQGGDDRCVATTETEGQESRFSAVYERVLLQRARHFPQREAPGRSNCRGAPPSDRKLR